MRRDSHGKELIFDYGKDESGQFIKALRPFFLVYASYPVKFAKKEDLRLIVKDIELKILHEIAHHVLMHAEKYGEGMVVEKIEAESEAFGMKILDALNSDIIVCQNDMLQGYRKGVTPYAGEGWLSWATNTWAIHRSTGFGIFFPKDYSYKEGDDLHPNPLAEIKKGLKGWLYETRFEMSSGLDLSDWQFDSLSPSQITYVSKPGTVGGMYARVNYEWLKEKLIVSINENGIATSADLFFSGSDPNDSRIALDGKIELICRSEFQNIEP